MGAFRSSFGSRGGLASKATAAAERFDSFLNTACATSDPRARCEALEAWDDHPDGRAAHPREEHLLPLLVAAGAAGQGAAQPFRAVMGGFPVTAFHFP